MKAATAILAALLVVVSTFASVTAQVNETKKLEIEVELEDSTAKVDVKADSVKTKFTLNTTDRDEIIKEIAARTGLSLEVVRESTKFKEEKKKSELEIEVEFENGAAKVEAEFDSTEMKFVLNTTDREEIIREISARTGLTIEQVKNAIEFEAELKKKIKDAEFPVKKRTVIFQLKRHLLGMEEVIKFAKEQNITTTKLEELRNNFASVIEKMEQVVAGEEKDPLGRYVSEAVKIAKEFREESRKLLGNKAEEAKERVKKATEEDRNKTLVNESDRIRAEEATHTLNAFDAHVENSQKNIDRLAAAGLKVETAQKKLNEIKTKRAALVNAINAFVSSCQGKPLRCDNPEHDRLKKIKEDIRKEFKELDEVLKEIHQGERILHLAGQLERAIARAGETLKKAEEKGQDVTVYRAKLNEIRKILNNAKEKANAGNVREAMNDLRSGHVALTNVLKDLAKTKKEFLKELREKRKEEKREEKASAKNESNGKKRGGKR